MTLDKRIEKDLKELYNNGSLNGTMNEANQLSIDLFGATGNLSANGLPGHFVGDRDAQTVLVMLNPQVDVKDNDKLVKTKETISKLRIDASSLIKFINTFKSGHADFGNLDKGTRFDVKQARFLKPWKDSGVTFPPNFPQDKKTYPDAKKAVLLKKLQLELVPYCSKTFDIQNKNVACLTPLVDTLFDEIFRVERTYIIFCGKIFEDIFNKTTLGTKINSLSKKVGPQIANLKSKSGTPINSHCHVIKIYYNNQWHKALIANSYAHRRLNGKAMSAYGEFCYNTYINSKI